MTFIRSEQLFDAAVGRWEKPEFIGKLTLQQLNGRMVFKLDAKQSREITDYYGFNDKNGPNYHNWVSGDTIHTEFAILILEKPEELPENPHQSIWDWLLPH